MRYSKTILMLAAFVCACGSDDGSDPVGSGQQDLFPAGRQGEGNPPLEMLPAGELLAAAEALPDRAGPQPNVNPGVPHQMQNQIASIDMQDMLTDNIRELLGVVWAPTSNSLAGSQGWYLDPVRALGPRAAFLNTQNEFGHSHTPSEGSMHMRLRPDFAQIVVDKGWGAYHPNNDSQTGADSDYVMVYGSRDEDEVNVVWVFVQSSYAFASGAIPLL